VTPARQHVALTAGLAVLIAAAVASATTLGPAARRMPLVVAIPTLVLLVFEAARQARAAAVEVDDTAARRLERVTFAWLGGLLASVWALGMLAGLPLFLAAYLRSRSGESWVVALGMALGVWAVLFGILDSALGIQMHDGLLGSLLAASRP
jgi:hypothetical protein